MVKNTVGHSVNYLHRANKIGQKRRDFSIRQTYFFVTASAGQILNGY
jgi:hypothetical protein